MLKSKVVKKVSLIVLLGLVILSFAILPKKVSAQGYSGCLWIQNLIGNWVCVRDTDHFNCDPGYNDTCGQFNEHYACDSAYHQCTPNTTPTPLPGYYRCKWLYSPFIPGWVCVLDNNHCTSGVADCDQYTNQGQVACENATHMCVVNTPTPTLTPTIGIPTIDPRQACIDACNEDPSHSHPIPQCLLTYGVDPPGCVNPINYDNLDCVINGVRYDCLCCQLPTPRLLMSPLCPGQKAINTAIGCIPLGDQNEFLVFILRWAIGIAGGVSFLLIVYSGFVIMTAGGDKRKVQAGRELLTAAISGLILIIFSVFILDLIGVRILQIPGLVP
jgi:hypothetical protein